MHLLRITEYGPPQPLTAQLVDATGLTTERAETAILDAGERLRRQHRLRNSPIQISGGLARAEDIAGVVSLRPGVDLQIVPKYAQADLDWASDLLFLSLFTTYGRLDALKPIAAGIGDGNALAELAARTLLENIHANARAPLRMRRRVTFASFEPDEEIEPDDMLLPEEEGWRQAGYRLTSDNPYVATLAAACRLLVPHVRSVATKALLAAQIARFGQQTHEPLRMINRLPSRLARWQNALDLALALLRGNSLSPRIGKLTTLGFTISTWRTWETLIERALVLAYGGSSVRLQPRLKLGTLTREAINSEILVQPDAVVTGSSGELVIDAKYKGRSDHVRTIVSAADRYEILAFMLASGAPRAALVYPATDQNSQCGRWERFETFDLPSGDAAAFTLSLNGISKPGGLNAFLHGLRSVVLASQP